jgi:FKBP-type peptidyl-prolyl cis-trans isomerase SlyD
MNVFANTVVSLTFKLFDDRKRADRGGARADHLPARRLLGHLPARRGSVDAQEGRRVDLGDARARDAFGDYDASMVRMEPVDALPPDLSVGGYVVSEQDGEETVWRVTDIADGKAVLDANHELAGQRLRFEATVVDIRPATQEEVSHGHVHGAHGHHHH